MEYTLGENNNFKSKELIVSLSVVALIFKCISCYNYMGFNGNEIFWDWLILSLVPCVMWLIYIVKFYEQNKLSILVPLLLGMLSFEYLYEVRSSLELYLEYSYFEKELVIFPVMAILFAMSAFFIWRGLSENIIVKITMGMAILFMSYFLGRYIIVYMPRYIEYYGDIQEWFLGSYISFIIMGYIGDLIFYVIFLFFVLKNRIPAVGEKQSIDEQHNNRKNSSPEDALINLKEKFERGIITEEEYREQRNQIIKNL